MFPVLRFCLLCLHIYRDRLEVKEPLESRDRQDHQDHQWGCAACDTENRNGLNHNLRLL